MRKPSSGEYAAGYQKYFYLLSDGNYLDLLRENAREAVGFFQEVPAAKLDHKYAEVKWTIKELLMHIVDTERVFSYRALAAARGDSATPQLPGWTKSYMPGMSIFLTELCKV